MRAEAGKQPVIWKQEAECVREVSWRDIDGDGTPEIKTSASGGGSGVLISDAVFYRWPANTPEPEEVVRFVQNSYVSSGLVWVEYGFEPKEFPNFTFYEDSFLPLGAKCPSRDECELVERKTFCIEECREEVPDTIVQEPGWPAFVEALAKDGFLPGNLEPSGDVPEVKAETQAAFDAWLSD
ncbi:hypothetical protein G3256_05945 [Roseobacter ponti]|uniref:Uncharacterized protein n=1 Tax=Roseobacter ponti TaxID=1891787 RepID=A0A858ST25_9RHOB|nr:hypothetical protein G3256_05945 [Roseobacter ponti]